MHATNECNVYLHNHAPHDRVKDATGDCIKDIGTFFALWYTSRQTITHTGSNQTTIGHTNQTIVHGIRFDIPFVHGVHTTGRHGWSQTATRLKT